MRISAPSTSHLAGMSALWHDAEYLPEKQLYTPTVEKGLEGMPLPSERHQLPEGATDPFAVQEKAYDVAAAQMERGIKGMEFLHGKTNRFEEITSPGAMNAPVSGTSSKDGPSFKQAPAPLAEANDLTRTYLQQQHEGLDPYAPTRVAQLADAKASADQRQKRAEAGTAPPRVSQTTAESNATQKSQRAQKALEMAEGLGVAMAGVALAQAVDPAQLGGMAAAEAASVVKAAAVSKLSVSMSGSIADMPDAVRTERARHTRSKRILDGEEPEEG